MARRRQWGDAVLVNATGLLHAPADQPAGERGIRGVAAAVVTFAALVTLTYGSKWDMPLGSRMVMLAAGAGLVTAALLLWTARRRGGIVVAAGLVVLAVPAWATVESARQREAREADKWGGMSFNYDEHGPMITRDEAEAVPKGATKDEVKAILGPAAGSGIQRVHGGDDLRCRIYRAADRPDSAFHTYALCFTGDRYTDLR
jgi:hypothetical protein